MHKQWHQRTNPTYTYRKGNIFYFRRKIPSDLRCQYNRPVFVQSLRTTSSTSAEKAATILSARLDEQCQEDAQKNKRGLWAEEDPVAPWDWRRRK